MYVAALESNLSKPWHQHISFYSDRSAADFWITSTSINPVLPARTEECSLMVTGVYDAPAMLHISVNSPIPFPIIELLMGNFDVRHTLYYYVNTTDWTHSSRPSNNR